MPACRCQRHQLRTLRERAFFIFFQISKNAFLRCCFFSTDIFSKRRKRSLAKSSVLGSSKWLHNFALVLHFYHLSVIICFNCYGQPPYHGWIAYNNNYYYITCWCAVKKLLLLTHLRRTDWVVSKTTYVFALIQKNPKTWLLRFWVARVFSGIAIALDISRETGQSSVLNHHTKDHFRGQLQV